MIDKLMCRTAIVLKNIEIYSTGCLGDFLCDGLYTNLIYTVSYRQPTLIYDAYQAEVGTNWKGWPPRSAFNGHIYIV